MRRMNGHDLRIGPEMLLFLDVDLTLLPSMSRDSTSAQQKLLCSLFNKTNQGIVFVTGRSMESLVETFPGMPLASVEHHAAYRLPNGSLVEHVKTPDTIQIAKDMSDALKGQFPIFTPADNAGARGVILESKQYSFAAVHNNTVTQDEIALLTDAMHRVYTAHGLDDSHEVKVGFDAVEISVKGMDKSHAVHDFMKDPLYAGRKPIFAGDSMADAKGMEACFTQYDGRGIAVGNHGIPDGEPYVHFRADSIKDMWRWLTRLEQHPNLNCSSSISVVLPVPNAVPRPTL